MKIRIFIICMLFLFLQNCFNKAKEEKFSIETKSETLRKLTIKDEIDSFTNNQPTINIHFVKLNEKDIPIKVDDGYNAETLVNRFEIVEDNTGNILTIKENPTSSNSESYKTIIYYFTKLKKTFAIVEILSSIRNKCNSYLATKTTNTFYDENFKVTAKTYKLEDDKNNELSIINCLDNKIENEIYYKNVEEYLNAKQILLH